MEISAGKVKIQVIFLFLMCVTNVLFSQNNSQVLESANATFLNKAPVIDGEVMEDATWQSVAPFGKMTQVQPKIGQSASEKTDIRIGYDDRTFYLSVVCYDAQPEGIVVTDARRDGNLDATDAFLFILDTYHNGQDGFVFGTNSIGTQYDAQVDNEGQGNFNNNRQQGGTIGGFNLNWDASWEVVAKVGDFGWSAEFAIPLKTIRFAPGENRTWGINFQRNIQKSNEKTFWAPLPNGFNLYRLSMAGDLNGLTLKKPGNLKLIPYVLGQTSSVSSNDPLYDGVDEGGTKAAAGVDLKYSVSPSMTLDLTYNTDFAQVEVDDQQVNLDRFNLFFPEKRPFFLENAGLFSVGSPGEVDLFFSRRIGIGAGGAQVPIIGGARLSGRMNQTNVGILNMYTDEVSEFGIDKNAFTVARVDHQLGQRTSVGGLFVNRSSIGSEEDSKNSTFALDGKIGIGKQAQITGYFSKTNTANITEGDHSLQLKGNYAWNNWIIRVGYTEVGEGFNPEVGFLFRQAFRKPEFLVLYAHRYADSSPMLEIRPHISWRAYWNFEGFQETSFLHIDNHWVWKTGTEVHTGVNFTTEGVVAPFLLSGAVEVPAGVYDHAEAQIVFFTNPNKPFSISTRHILGGFFGGKRYANSGTLTIRAGDKFSSQWSLSHNDLRLPNGNFTTDVFRSRLSYSFTPQIFLQGLIQYNSVSDIISSNLRFGWLQQSNTGLFVVYNFNQDNSYLGEDYHLNNQSFIVKFSKLFDVLK